MGFHSRPEHQTDDTFCWKTSFRKSHAHFFVKKKLLGAFLCKSLLVDINDVCLDETLKQKGGVFQLQLITPVRINNGASFFDHCSLREGPN